MLKQRKIVIQGIPCYEIWPEGESVKADLLLYHGWGSHATKQCFRAKLLAGFGYRVLVPELIYHGERGACVYDAANSAVRFLEVLLQSIREARGIFDEAFSKERSCFVIGHSLGGMIAIGTAADNADRIDGFVAMNSTAQWSDYEKMMCGVFPNQSLDVLESEDFLSVAAQLSHYAPKLWLEQGMMKPVLLTNGALDQTLPAAFNTLFCREYTLGNVLQMVFPDAGHVVTDSMLLEVLEFIKKHTKPRK